MVLSELLRQLFRPTGGGGGGGVKDCGGVGETFLTGAGILEHVLARTRPMASPRRVRNRGRLASGEGVCDGAEGMSVGFSAGEVVVGDEVLRLPVSTGR